MTKKSIFRTVITSILLLITCLVFITPVYGTDIRDQQQDTKWLHEVRLGVLAHDVDNMWSGSRKESGSDFNGELIFDRMNCNILSGTVRPNLGASINSSGDTSKLYGGLIWESKIRSSMFLNMGLGAAIHNGESLSKSNDMKSLGSSLLFRVPFEFGFEIDKHHRISIMFDHISNGYIKEPNEGLDTLGIRYGFRF